MRTIAALVAIALGLLLVGGVLYSVLAEDPESPVFRDEPGEVTVGRLDPIDPGGSKGGKLRTATDVPKAEQKWLVYETEYGGRGEHEVTIAVRGSQFGFSATWRDKHEEEGAAEGGWSKTRTVKGGSPLAAVTIYSFSGSASCTITVDGIETDSTSVGPGGFDWCLG
jgi:hypothetical protein